MSKHLDKLDDLFARFDSLEAETLRQARSADELLLSISDDQYEATLICYGNMIWDPASRRFITEITDRDTLTNPEEHTE